MKVRLLPKSARPESSISTVVAIAMVFALALAACGAAGGGRNDADTSNSGGDLPGSAAWGRVLSAYHLNGGLDYAGIQAARTDLDEYLEALSGASVDGSSREEALAFWINAYNAVVTEFVLRDYPEIRSVKDAEGFFDSTSFRVAGEDLTLDEIETRGRDLGDPRIHFAVVCASTSCPDLRGEPYRPERLYEQLEEQTRLFLGDPSKGLRFDSDDNVLWLSSIFKWYADDFTGGSRVVAFFARGRVLEWVLPHLSEDLSDSLLDREPSVRYLDYDWSLNDRLAELQAELQAER